MARFSISRSTIGQIALDVVKMFLVVACARQVERLADGIDPFQRRRGQRLDPPIRLVCQLER